MIIAMDEVQEAFSNLRQLIQEASSKDVGALQCVSSRHDSKHGIRICDVLLLVVLLHG